VVIPPVSGNFEEKRIERPIRFTAHTRVDIAGNREEAVFGAGKV